MRLTYPHMGNLDIILKALFEGFGAEVVTPPPITERTLSLGVQYSPEFACIPLKINVGNFIEALELGADTIIMLGGIGPCRFGYYGQVEREILKDLGYNPKMVIIEPPQGRLIDFLKDFGSLFPGLTFKKVINAVKLAWEKMAYLDKMEKAMLVYRAHEVHRGAVTDKYNEYRGYIDESMDPKEVKELGLRAIEEMKSLTVPADDKALRIAVVGEIYFLIEPYPSQDIFKELNELGVEVEKTEYISDYVLMNIFPRKLKKIKEAARPYLNRVIGGHAINTIGNTRQFADMGYDGIIQIFPFTCTPEIVAQGILNRMSRDLDIPVMSLSYDENTGQAGYQTRIEAFVDLLMRRREMGAVNV
ncbi:2-hydroxyacyl-CoA dehydratase [Calorimonas adulescens]|uniref:CoA protein activase n=1 Tax=Calorimonas adulescens TaxID=2606906 RepID=A0A5D8QIF8_9THEO|nr:2-hydroxyacyl-CoA dehydratase [Calorimonas adulescens]TZE83098.1 hypothetical protein FWJ32_01885 [Calorimonas adulescens]